MVTVSDPSYQVLGSEAVAETSHNLSRGQRQAKQRGCSVTHPDQGTHMSCVPKPPYTVVPSIT